MFYLGIRKNHYFYELRYDPYILYTDSVDMEREKESDFQRYVASSNKPASQKIATKKWPVSFHNFVDCPIQPADA